MLSDLLHIMLQGELKKLSYEEGKEENLEAEQHTLNQQLRKMRNEIDAAESR